MNSSPNAPWKEGRERSERWKETLSKGFLPRVSDRTRTEYTHGYIRPYSKQVSYMATTFSGGVRDWMLWHGAKI